MFGLGPFIKQKPLMGMSGVGGGLGALGGSGDTFTATGGNIANGLEPGNGYAYHTFTTPGNFVIENDGGKSIEILMVAAGGGAGSDNGGGGGAGGLIHVPGYALGTGTYALSGSWNTGGAGAPPPRQKGTPGANMVLTLSGPGATLTAIGGGAGSDDYDSKHGDPGGSGGGAFDPPGTGGSGTQPGQAQPLLPAPNYNQYGSNGGNFSGSPTWGAGGGGGASSAGNLGTPGGPGYGGEGKQYPQFDGDLIGLGPSIGPKDGWYAAGGNGGAQDITIPGRMDGIGGEGGDGIPQANKDAIDLTGSGGGGGPNPATGGDGGSGLFVLRYPV